MNLTIALSNEDLNCKSIVDTIDNTNCFFRYYPEDDCGYCHFNSKSEYLSFCEKICDLRDIIFYLNRCNDL